MPASLANVNATNVLFFVPADASWQERLRLALRDTAQDNASAVDAHLALLEKRAKGEYDWRHELGERATRVFNDGLLEGRLLPLYKHGAIHFTVDLFNPNNEAADPYYDPGFQIIEVLVPRKEIYPWERGIMPDGSAVDYGNPAQYAKQVVCGEAVGDIVARWAERLLPTFACADINYLSLYLRTATNKGSVTNPAPVGTQFWEYLWSLSYWSPELLNEKLTKKLTSLAVTPEMRAKFDPFWGSGIKPTWRKLATGGLLVQHRFIFADFRGMRAHVDAPLARQAGLRSTNLIYRT